MQQILRIVAQKPPIIVLCILVYVLTMGILKWKFTPPLEALLFIAGGVLGIYFTDIAEIFFTLHPSPFRTIVFQTIFVFVCIFVVTSSGSVMASGLVLSIYLTMLLSQLGEFQIRKNLNSWYEVVATSVTRATQRNILIAFACLFLLLSFIFIK